MMRLSKSTTTAEFIVAANGVHGHKYNYSETVYISAYTPIKIICYEHGLFMQKPTLHLHKKHGCKQCGYKKILDLNRNSSLGINEFIRRSNIKHNNEYDYSKAVYINSKAKLSIICHKHGQFLQAPINHMNGQRCPTCARETRNANMRSDTAKFADKANIAHGNTYIYDKSSYISSKLPITITCHKHGDFIQIPNSHLNGKGCHFCAEEKLSMPYITFEEFKLRAINEHGDIYIYDGNTYDGMKEKMSIYCEKHGTFWQSPASHIAGVGCSRCHSSKIQLDIDNYLKSIGISDTIFNSRDIIPPREIDIFVPSRKFGIEHHGLYWHSYDKSETTIERLKHYNKYNDCKINNIKLLQIFENEWLFKQDIVKSIISNNFGISNTIYARDCKISQLNNNDCKVFMNKNHIQGHRSSSIIYGLIKNDNILCALSISRHPKYEYEIIRYANNINTIVVGGLHKLLHNFVKLYNPKSIMTYICRRFFDGHAYLKFGFEQNSTTQPNYYYIKQRQLYSRQKFQKHKLEKLLDHYDPTISESQNMFNNGYRRIWDAGHLKLVWKSNG